MKSKMHKLPWLVSCFDSVRRIGFGQNHDPASSQRGDGQGFVSERFVGGRPCFLGLQTVGLAFLLCSLRIQAAPYEISWFSVDGGGGTSTGGLYSVSGTIGQPDAGAATGGPYSLLGGFWSLLAVQQTGLPTLIIKPAGTNVILSWSTNSTGFVLQASSGITPPSWADAPSGTNNPVTVPATGLARFYRLRKQ
jgi:hypothetical protein